MPTEKQKPLHHGCWDGLGKDDPALNSELD